MLGAGRGAAAAPASTLAGTAPLRAPAAWAAATERHDSAADSGFGRNLPLIFLIVAARRIASGSLPSKLFGFASKDAWRIRRKKGSQADTPRGTLKPTGMVPIRLGPVRWSSSGTRATEERLKRSERARVDAFTATGSWSEAVGPVMATALSEHVVTEVEASCSFLAAEPHPL